MYSQGLNGAIIICQAWTSSSTDLALVEFKHPTVFERRDNTEEGNVRGIITIWIEVWT